MKSGRVFAAAIVLAGPLLLSTACDPPAPFNKCGSVDQAPFSDVGAWDIKAHNVGCSTARAVAHQVHTHGGLKPYSYLGWKCTGGIFSGGLGSFIWCNGPSRGVISWSDV